MNDNLDNKEEKSAIQIRVLMEPEEIAAIEGLQSEIWRGSDIEIIPLHLLLTIAQNDGLVIGGFVDDKLVGFVFGFLAFYQQEGERQLKYCSHQLGVHPDYRSSGLGYRLKRAQWQLVRKQGIDLITWTYDPLLSTNAYLNISKLGAVCNTYKRNQYGELRDALNVGLPTDRFLVNWWVNSKRVINRLSKRPRRKLDLAHFLSAGAYVINPTELNDRGLPVVSNESFQSAQIERDKPAIVLVEIPADFLLLKSKDKELGLFWRLHTRELFTTLFNEEYIITDFIHMPGKYPRSYYVLSRGDITIGE